jgi:uncharacterized protein
VHAPSASVLALLASIAMLAGTAKGLTGFGGALVMAPLFSLLIDVPDASVLIVLVHAATSLQGVKQWKPHVRWRAVVPLGLVAVACAATLAHVLRGIDVNATRRLIGCAVLGVTAMHLAGWRWRHHGGWAPTLTAGVISGGLTALGGLGGPPAFYYFAGIEQGAALRAQLLGFFTVLFCGTASMLALEGRVSTGHLLASCWLLPAFVIGVMIGERAHGRLPEKWFDRAVSGLLLGSALIALIH